MWYLNIYKVFLNPLPSSNLCSFLPSVPLPKFLLCSLMFYFFCFFAEIQIQLIKNKKKTDYIYIYIHSFILIKYTVSFTSHVSLDIISNLLYYITFRFLSFHLFFFFFPTRNDQTDLGKETY